MARAAPACSSAAPSRWRRRARGPGPGGARATGPGGPGAGKARATPFARLRLAARGFAACFHPARARCARPSGACEGDLVEGRLSRGSAAAMLAAVRAAAICRIAAACVAVAWTLAAPCAHAQGAPPWRLVLDPAASEVHFELAATLHTVRGSFALRAGEVRFDPASGAIAGRVAIDAASGVTGNARRDRNMHEQVLESRRYPEIVLTPERMEVTRIGGESLTGVIHGRIEIHGGSHPVAMPVEAARIAPGRARVEGRFEVPYVAWGLEDPSTFLLRVDPSLVVRFVAVGDLAGPGPGAAGGRPAAATASSRRGPGSRREGRGSGSRAGAGWCRSRSRPPRAAPAGTGSPPGAASRAHRC